MAYKKLKFDYLMEYGDEIELLSDGLSLRRVRSRTGRAINTLRKLRAMFLMWIHLLQKVMKNNLQAIDLHNIVGLFSLLHIDLKVSKIWQWKTELSTLDLVFSQKNSIFVMRTYNIYKDDIFWIYQTLPDGRSAIDFIVSVKYLQQYVDEFCFRLNNRDYDNVFMRCVQLAVA